MSPISLQFKDLLQSLSARPYIEQEDECVKIEHDLGNFMRKFPSYALKVYKAVFGELAGKSAFYAEGKDILEIGPGNSLGVAFLAAVSGARKVSAIEAYAHDMADVSDFIVSAMRALAKDSTVLARREPFKTPEALYEAIARVVQQDENGRFIYRPERISNLYPYFADDLPFEDNAFDLVYSCASFEHFRNTEKVAAELARVTRPGG